MSGVVDSGQVLKTGQVLRLDLVARAKAGDHGAFTALLRPAIAPAYRLAGAMLHDPHAAEDVVQDASLKAWRKLDQLKAGTEMQPWFLGIVANEVPIGAPHTLVVGRQIARPGAACTAGR
jgi:hypothetical protein